jgi:hypothetical protein
LVAAHVLASYVLVGVWFFIVAVLTGLAQAHPLTVLALVAWLFAPITMFIGLIGSIETNDHAVWIIWGAYLFTTFLAYVLLRRLANKSIGYPPGRCSECGYDLRASPDRCPECGAVVPTLTRA